jgi:hypothetical protein
MNPTVTKMDSLDDNSETNEDGGTRTSGPNTHLKWTNTPNFNELEKYINLKNAVFLPVQ